MYEVHVDTNRVPILTSLQLNEAWKLGRNGYYKLRVPIHPSVETNGCEGTLEMNANFASHRCVYRFTQKDNIIKS